MRTFLAVLFLFIAVGLGGVYAVLRTRSQVVAESAPMASEAPAAAEAASPAPPPDEAPVVAAPPPPPPPAAPTDPGGLGLSGVGEGGGGMGFGSGLGSGAGSGRLGGGVGAGTTGASPRALGPKAAKPEATAVARSLPKAEAAPAEVQVMAAPPPPPPPLAETFKAREVAYNRPPSKLVMGKPIEVSLAINATAKAGAAAEAVQGFEGEVVEREVELSDVVSAQLTGSGFHIESVTVERQKLSDRVANRWQWTVTPTEPGSQTLILEIFGYANGSTDAEPLDAYRDTIDVEVEQMDVLLGLAAKYEPLFGFGAGVAGALSATFGLLRVIGGRKKA